MKIDSVVKKAIKSGKLQATAIVENRNKINKKRIQVAKRNLKANAIQEQRVSSKTIDALGTGATAGVLVAEGDSWFHYPGADILNLLEDEFDYDVEDVAQRGDRIEEMAYSDGQLEDFVRKLEKALRNGDVPKAILLSGGGNDFADVFETVLNHASSPIPGLNENVVKEIVELRCRNSYIHIISAISHVCKKRVGNTIRIITHGYDYAVPDGRGYKFGPITSGPWLEPGFIVKGYQNEDYRKDIIRTLIIRFNKMLSDVSSIPGFEHVKYVDLRDTLASDSRNYKKWWDNELHPTKRGFRAVTKKFAEAIES